MIVVVFVIGVLASHQAPGFAAWRDEQRLEAAIRHLAGEVQRACSLAIASGRGHALAFDASARDLGWRAAADEDGDGVGSADLASGRDLWLGPWSRLSGRFPGVEPGRPGGVPTVAGGAVDRDGLAFGRGSLVACGADGGVRSGTLYLRASGRGAALRLYGPTGRQSLWWWGSEGGDWARLR